jgi:UDP-glucuronate 4-epimerase
VAERVLVTGAAGFIGSHTVDALLERGYSVVGIDNFDDFYDPAVKQANLQGALRHPEFALEVADIRDALAMRRIFAATRPDAVVHLAARAGVRPSIAEPALYANVNVVGTTVLLDAAREAGVDRVVVASTSSVYGNSAEVPFREDDPALHPISPYAATKRGMELLCECFAHLYPQMRIIALRFFTVYGPRQRPDLAIHKFTRLISAGEPVPFFGDGSDSRDYTYITDTVQGVLGALERTRTERVRYEVFNLGESATTTLSELVELIERAVGRAAVLDRRPPQPGDVRRTFADVSRARALLRYSPCVPINEGIPRFVEWYRRSAVATGQTGAN